MSRQSEMAQDAWDAEDEEAGVTPEDLMADDPGTPTRLRPGTFGVRGFEVE